MGTYLRVKNWAQHFENNRTRELQTMRWLPLPVKQDGDGYTELLDHENGAAHYGAWVAILCVAAKSQARGILMRDAARAHDCASLARVTRIARATLDEAIERLISVGWLERVDIAEKELTTASQEPASKSQLCRKRVRKQCASRARNRTVQESTEEENTNSARALKFAEFWSLYPPRDGRKLGKLQAEVEFAKLSESEQDRVLVAVKHYAASGQIPKDAVRWLRKPPRGAGDPPWLDWVDDAAGDPPRSKVPTDEELASWTP